MSVTGNNLEKEQNKLIKAREETLEFSIEPRILLMVLESRNEKRFIGK